MDTVNFIVYDVNSYEIISVGECPPDVFQMQASNPGQDVIEGIASSDSAYVVNGQIVLYTQQQKDAKNNRPNFSFVWSNKTFLWEDPRSEQQKYDSCVQAVNAQRIQLLYESDWTQIPNNPLTEQLQQDWANYRQQLRDIPQQSGYPFNVVWPTAPAT